MAGAEDIDFERLMARMGVRPLDRGGAEAGSAPAPRRSGRKGRRGGRKGGAARQAAPEDSPRPGGAGDAPRGDADRGGAEGETAPAAAERAPAPAEDAAAAGERRADAAPPGAEAPTAPGEEDAPRRRVGALEERVEHLEDEVRRLEEEVDLVRGERRILEERLRSARREAAEAPDGPSLGRLFGGRGLKGLDEAAFLVRALAEERLLEPLLEMLRPARPDALVAFLEDRVCLLCGREGCAAPPGRAVVTVPPERCEVCGGEDLRAAVRRFEDAFLVNGFTRVAVVGGTATAHRQLRDLVWHRQLRLRFLPGDAGEAGLRLGRDRDEIDVVVHWSEAAPELPWVARTWEESLEGGAEHPRRARGVRVVHVRPGPVARMMLDVADALLSEG